MCFWHFWAPKTMNRSFRSFGKVLKGQKNLKIAEKSSKYHISEHCHHFCLRHLKKSSTFLMFLRFSKVQTISDKIETYSGHSREHAYKMKEPNQGYECAQMDIGESCTPWNTTYNQINFLFLFLNFCEHFILNFFLNS